MGQRGRTHGRGEPPVASAIDQQQQPLSQQQQQQQQLQLMSNKQIRQFTTRSRAKSTASFKGLRRMLAHDGGGQGSNLQYDERHAPIKCKSSDSISRKRVISGLNMTALSRVKSNPNSIGAAGIISPRDKVKQYYNQHHHYLNHHSHPRQVIHLRSKSSHSVLNLEDVVEQYTKNKEEMDRKKNADGKDRNDDKDYDDYEEDDELKEYDGIGEEEEEEEEEEEGGTQPETMNNLSPDDKVDHITLSSQEETLSSSNSTHIGNVQTSELNGDDRGEIQKPCDIQTALVAHHDKGKVAVVAAPEEVEEEDRIDIPTLDNVETSNVNEEHASLHSLTRQGSKFTASKSNDTKPSNTDDASATNATNKSANVPSISKAINGTQKQRQHATQEKQLDYHPEHEANTMAEHYIPTMILSQSTGMERTFQEPASIQNSLANELKRPGRNTNIEQQHIVPLQSQELPDQAFAQQPLLPNTDRVPTATNKNINNQNLRLKHSDIGTLSTENKADTRTSHSRHNSTNQHAFSTSIPSLTSNLQNALQQQPQGSYHKTSRIPSNILDATNNNSNTNIRYHSALRNENINTINNIDRKKSKLKENGTSNYHINNNYTTNTTTTNNNNNTKSDLSASLNRKTSSSVLKTNNFQAFLKSDDNDDDDSRTQRKLWLQRESSIMDLNLQNDNNNPDSIFMASNIEVKREFERITHEYINVKRFSNPLNEALAKLESLEKPTKLTRGSSSSPAATTNNNNPSTNNSGTKDRDIQSSSLLSSYLNPSKKPTADGFLPGEIRTSKLQRILSSIWREESISFNRDINPLNKSASHSNSNGNNINNMKQSHTNVNGYYSSQNHSGSNNTLRHSSIRSVMGTSATNMNQPLYQHQRVVNSLQPTTRAVNRRMENVVHHQQQR
ncbi:Tco89p NDAI_0F02230 [Naumovozyma dairenensis CBS 421]|uniref:Uncharacterized protein n=1 Tax=Naumovozyma dairenensis (strain ATCC 10597 / BCRC 20456 / CBS 421 / NBRC 0211 / NRRL Y-12639) TaxID=1071378 RepID=G0WCN0_NAUDC|nr:hypothetical protein NDAI_0F02230 [Naumovozyma dairenensis CBS 421]CCD25541.1 hypothetical protein NDAI_0F02230 [Naumovozyma dairenensis CBS 421]